MAGRGETVKYVIDADTSGFSRGMSTAALESEIAGKRIDRSLSSTNKGSENNFRDIQKNASRTAVQIRSFGTALSGFNMTSIIVGITALSGVTLQLAGAFAAAGSAGSLLLPIFAQGGAAFGAFKTGVSGLSAAFKAIGQNNGKAFLDSMVNLGPAAKQVAFGVAGLNKAFNSIRLNTQQALLQGVGSELLRLGALILPTVNAGFQIIGRSMNGVFKQAASLASQPIFSSLLATIFADTAHNVDILSGALAPLFSIFTNVYLVTRAYVSLLAEQVVNLLKSAAAYLNTAHGQEALNIAIQEGLIAIKDLGNFAGAVFGLLTSIFRTSVISGNSLIVTLTGLVKGMENFVNSAKGQQDLTSLFNFTSIVIKRLAADIGFALQGFFDILNVINSLNPQLQSMIVLFLAFALAIGPVGGYFLKLFSSIRLVIVTIFNLGEQAIIVFGALGGLSSVVIILAVALIALSQIVKGPLGSAFLIIGALLVFYIGLNFLLAQVVQVGAASFWEQAFAAFAAEGAEADLAATQGILAITMLEVAAAGEAAGAGLGFAASAAEFLQAALIPLLILAAGVLIILSMLGVFSSKGKQAQGASIGLGNSLGALQNSMKGVGTTGANAANNGLAPLSDSLNNVGDAAIAAQGQLASFDKMNVLTSNINPNAGISGIPSLPNVGGANGGSLGAPPIDTGAFDKSLADMQKNFDGLKNNIGQPITNPFDAIGKWIDAHPWIALTGFVIILAAIAAIFIIAAIAAGGFSLATLPLTLTLGLIVIAIIAIIAIIIILVQNWSTVWGFIVSITESVWNSILIGAQIAITAIGNFFTGLWNGIIAVWGVAAGFFAGVWVGIQGAFGSVVGFFGNVFGGAWNAIKGAFGGIGGFFQGVWNTIVNIFGSVGAAVGDAIAGAVKFVINSIINTVANIVNTVIDLINGAIGLINHLPGVHVGAVGRVTLPRLAQGGIINSPTTAVLGEAGPEAVMPLQNNTEWIDKLASKINTTKNPSSTDTHIASNLDAKAAGNKVTINVSGVFATSVAEQRKVADLIAKRINESVNSKTAGAF